MIKLKYPSGMACGAAKVRGERKIRGEAACRKIKQEGEKKMKAKKLFAAGLIAAGAMSMAVFADAAVQLNGTNYDTLAAAIRAAETTKSTITLTEDVKLTDPVDIGVGQDITLDLANSILTCENMTEGITMINNYGKLTVVSTGTGDIQASMHTDNKNKSLSAIFRNYEGAEMTISNEAAENAVRVIILKGCDNVIRNSGTLQINNMDLSFEGEAMDSPMTNFISNENGIADIKRANICLSSIECCNGTVNVEKDVSFTDTFYAVSMGGTINLNDVEVDESLYVSFIRAFGEGADATININGGKWPAINQIEAWATNGHSANVNINGGVFDIIGGIYVEPGTFTINNGTFSNVGNLTDYLAMDKMFDENGTVISKNAAIALTDKNEFVNFGDKTHAGYYFNVSKDVDEKKTAVAVFTAENKTLSKTLDLSAVEGNGKVEFSILLLGAPETVTGEISYK